MIRDVAKQYGGAQALRAVSLDLDRGEVHGLVGANGAGKSTLVKLLAGLDAPDSGAFVVDGRTLGAITRVQAQAFGFAFIHQELNLVPRFSAVETLMLGQPVFHRWGLVDRASRRKAAAQVLRRLHADFKPDTPVGDLSIASRWLVAIGRVLVAQPRLIVMDEPTASFSEAERERLFSIIRELTSGGVTILYVSHVLEEIIAVCDRTTIFRDGRSVGTSGRSATSRESLIRAIVGADIPAQEAMAATVRESDRVGDELVLEARHLSRGRAVRDVSFNLHRGEILGLAGLVGSGRSELARLIVGADRAEHGEVLLSGVPVRRGQRRVCARLGVGFVPEERRTQGLVLSQTVEFNVNIGNCSRAQIVKGLGLVSKRLLYRQAANASERIGLPSRWLAKPVGRLSGGQQQKALLARSLVGVGKVLVLDEPTRGIDVGARAEMHTVIRQIAASGVGVIMISSESEELVGKCHRILVMAHGHVVAQVRGAEATPDMLTQLSYTPEDLEPVEAR